MGPAVEDSKDSADQPKLQGDDRATAGPEVEGNKWTFPGGRVGNSSGCGGGGKVAGPAVGDSPGLLVEGDLAGLLVEQDQGTGLGLSGGDSAGLVIGGNSAEV